MGSKYGAINTSDYRLAMMGFTHPDSTQLKKYVHQRGDLLERRDGVYGVGWYWTMNSSAHYCSLPRGWSFKKRSIVAMMEASLEYGGGCLP